MRTFGVVSFGAAVVLCGCIQVPKDINLNINTADRANSVSGGGKGGSSAGEGRQGESSTPSQLPASGGGWRNAAAGVVLDAEQGVLFYAFDTLAYPNSPVDLAARLQSAEDIKGIADVTVAFHDGQELIGSAKTNADGLAILKWQPPASGNYQLTAKIAEIPAGARSSMLAVSPAPLLVAARDRDARLVVVDLDHTVVDSGFFRVLMGGARPMADSVDVIRRLAEVYTIVYLTHRPDLLTRKSKTWLSDNGYPAGPLLVSELKQAFGDSGKFKTAKIQEMRKAFPGAAIGIGDKLSDAEACAANGMTAYLIPHYKSKPKDMRKMATEVRRLGGDGRLHVVGGWRDIEAGIFRDQSFHPAAFARDLERRADQLEAAEKQKESKKEHDDDDDDD